MATLAPFMRFLKKIAASAGLCFAATVLFAAELTPQEERLVLAARREGVVTVLNPFFGDRAGQLLGEAFVKRYDLGPDFKFNNLRKGTGAVVAQVRQEIKAGRFTGDIVMAPAPGFFDEAARRDAFEPLDSFYWRDHEELARKAGQYFNYPYVVVPYAVSFQPVWNTACPGMANFTANSYDDVVKPELKGKTIVTDITKSLAYTTIAIAMMEAGVDMTTFWDRLKATDPIVEFRSEAKLQMVISCQRPLDMWNLTGRVYQAVLQKPDLAKVLKFGTYAEGQVMLGEQAAVLRGAPHPKAAKLFIEFMLTKEGTDIIVEDDMAYSFLKDYKPPAAAVPYLFDLNRTKLVGISDWVAAQGKFEAVRMEWQKRFQ